MKILECLYQSLSFVLLFTFFLSLTIAQNCDTLLDHGLYNVSVTQQKLDYQSKLDEEICSQEYNSAGESKQRSISAGLSYAGFGVSGGEAKGKTSYSESQKRYCSARNIAVGSTNGFSVQERTLVNRAISAWETCTELEAQKFLIETEISLETSTARFTFADRSGGSTVFQGVNVISREPSEKNFKGFTCTTNQDGTAVKLEANSKYTISSENFTIVCEREYLSRNLQGTEIYYSPPTTIIIPTSRDEVQIEFAAETIPEIQTEKARELQEQINLLTKAIAQLDDTPVGTIIASALPPATFTEAYGDSWILADGSDVYRVNGQLKLLQDSVYGQLACSNITDLTQCKIPDLRGMFLRGMNVGRDDGLQDPEGSRLVGNFQSDTFQGHWHDLFSGRNDNSHYHAQGNISGHIQYSGEEIFPERVQNPSADMTNGPPRVGSETRPKNVAVYFYIKIN